MRTKTRDIDSKRLIHKTRKIKKNIKTRVALVTGEKDKGGDERTKILFSTAGQKDGHKDGQNDGKVRGKHSVVGADSGEPVVLVITDQNFPAVLYSGDGGA